MTIIRAALLLSLGGAPLAAQSAAEPVIPDGFVRQATLSFDGRATVGNFTGTTSTVTGELHGGRLTEVRGWVEAPVRTLATGNKKRDRDLNKSMESDKYPSIRFELTGVDAPESRGDSISVSLHGRFIIHGVTREASIPATVAFHGGDIRVRGETPLNLKDYKIGGLTKMLGMLKMHEEILVHVDLMFGSAAPRAGAASLPAARVRDTFSRTGERPRPWISSGSSRRRSAIATTSSGSWGTVGWRSSFSPRT